MTVLPEARRVEVVSAFIIRGGRVLLQQRSPQRDYPLTWECPGGKVEHTDATPRHALIRELQEELGWQSENAICGAVDLSPCFVTTFDPPEVPKPFKLSFYTVVPEHDWQPKMLDAVGLGWFTVTEMGRLSLTPGNVKLYSTIVAIGFDKMMFPPR
jgi:8-oxo-dGTP diphosphatase